MLPPAFPPVRRLPPRVSTDACVATQTAGGHATKQSAAHSTAFQKAVVARPARCSVGRLLAGGWQVVQAVKKPGREQSSSCCRHWGIAWADCRLGASDRLVRTGAVDLAVDPASVVGRASDRAFDLGPVPTEHFRARLLLPWPCADFTPSRAPQTSAQRMPRQLPPGR